MSKYYLSEGQIRHFYYCLSRIGFQNEIIQTAFVEKLYQTVCNEFKNHKAESKDAKTGWIDYYPFGDREFMSIVYNKVANEVSFKKANLINDEIMDAPILSYIKKELNLKYVSATDISSFVYCPVSYCIQKSFVDLPISKEAKDGIEFHEMNRLVNYVGTSQSLYKVNIMTNNDSIYNDNNSAFFDDVRKSEVYYVGHGKNVKRYFKSSKGDFVGQPDYIFINSEGVKFIVEEKFKSIKEEKRIIKTNHKYQLSSYITGLDGLRAEYGYLVYWLYKYEEGIKQIKQCVVVKIEQNSIDIEGMRDIYRQIKKVNSGESLEFIRETINPSKCASCVVRKICGHKTGRFSDITVPYSEEYYALIR